MTVALIDGRTQPTLSTSPQPVTEATVQLVQNGRHLSRPADCEFGSEIGCVGGAKANELVVATVTSTQRLDKGLLALYLVW